ncbi:GNAT family N-acetyltransferase [Paenibacillus spongiae]|uniref:GNAT family N-acetyltransferase n=1 Tax=Paenibacillus spongiae TaxID=2909671 RepID=A0ABY5SFI5_9BACL|nr:GNAT family N-acetyltransferase [Paenibacillus spongiae]UVI32736.1 GNAT family N-acetyltransferase [Paenibacillus spongiae]
MIRACNERDVETIYAIINDAAIAYDGVIPEDCYHAPYMGLEELKREISDGVRFWGYGEDGELLGVMGMQEKGDVSLIRHAYVRTKRRGGGIGGQLLRSIVSQTDKPILIGTWEAAAWAISFYKRNGFQIVSSEEKEVLLRKYWKVSARQIETSVVLCNSSFHNEMRQS